MAKRATAKQARARKRFSLASKRCKGLPVSRFRSCVRSNVKGIGSGKPKKVAHCLHWTKKKPHRCLRWRKRSRKS